MTCVRQLWPGIWVRFLAQPLQENVIPALSSDLKRPVCCCRQRNWCRLRLCAVCSYPSLLRGEREGRPGLLCSFGGWLFPEINKKVTELLGNDRKGKHRFPEQSCAATRLGSRGARVLGSFAL